MIPANYTVDDVRALRERDGCSMAEANAYLRKQQLLEIIIEVRITGNQQHLLDVIEELLHVSKFG